MRSTGPDALSFELHYDVDLAESDLIDRVQSWLAGPGRAFCHDLRALAYERDRTALPVNVDIQRSLHEAVIAKGSERGATYRALGASAPPTHERRFGHALLRGKTPATFLTFDFDAYVPCRPSGSQWLFSNTIGGWIGRERLTGVPTSDWVRSMSAYLAADPRLMWGAAFMNSEFHERNLHDEADGAWALGRDVRRSLPGVFWLNLFGHPYIDLIGKARIFGTPNAKVRESNGTVMVELDTTPEGWSTAVGRERHDEVVTYLGNQFFFDRQYPDRQTVAPDFGLEPLPERKPFQAMTKDGKHFNVVDRP